MIKRDDVEVTNLNLTPGDEVPPHSVPINVLFYVVEGEGTIQVGEEKEGVKEKDIVTCPPNTRMPLYEDQDKEFSVLNIKTPSQS